jgi:hypothetical protein
MDSFRRMRGYPGQYVSQPLLRIDSLFLARGQERIDNGGSLRCIVRATE